MEPTDFFSGSALRVQERFGTRELAAHIARKYVSGALEPDHVAWVRAADAVYVATVDGEGNPECSYKGGLPGFIRVPDPQTIEIPSYDGNGMYRTLGNAADSRRIGLLFLFPRIPAKLRVNGSCELVTDAETLARHYGAEAVVRVRIREVFENCPRYLHDPDTGAYSAHCPRPDYRPPDPEWKLKPEYDPYFDRGER